MAQVKHSKLSPASGEVIELSSIELWKEALDVLRLLRPELDAHSFLQGREALMASGYRLFGLLHAGRIVCVAGVALHPHVVREKEFWVHDLVTLDEERSKGFGQTMMKHLQKIARESGCSRLMVHTRIERERARHFYLERLGYEPYAVVYQKVWEK